MKQIKKHYTTLNKYFGHLEEVHGDLTGTPMYEAVWLMFDDYVDLYVENYNRLLEKHKQIDADQIYNELWGMDND